VRGLERAGGEWLKTAGGVNGLVSRRWPRHGGWSREEAGEKLVVVLVAVLVQALVAMMLAMLVVWLVVCGHAYGLNKDEEAVLLVLVAFCAVFVASFVALSMGGLDAYTANGWLRLRPTVLPDFDQVLQMLVLSWFYAFWAAVIVVLFFAVQFGVKLYVVAFVVAFVALFVAEIEPVLL